MTTPKQLDELITNLQRGVTAEPQSSEEQLALNLIQFAESFHLDTEFTMPVSNSTVRINQFQPVLRNVAAIVAAMVGILILIISVPPFRAFAQEILEQLFVRNPEQTITFSNDGLIFEERDFATYESVADAQSAINFEIRLADIEDLDYVLESIIVTIPRNTIQTSYNLVSSTTNGSLRIVQQPLADAKEGIFWYSIEQNTISDEAKIVHVKIGDYSGELVQGEWVTSPSNPPTTEPPIYTWNDLFPIYRLRWQDETFLYEIKLVSTVDAAAQEILSIAENMMDVHSIMD